MGDLLYGRNPVIECLARRRRSVHRIWMDEGARPDARIQRLLALAAERGVRVQRVGRAELERRCEGGLHQGVAASVEPLVAPTTAKLVDSLFDAGTMPFLVLAHELSYEHNLGAILRSGLGFGVHGVIVPTRRGASLTPVVQRVAMGAAEEVPVVREGLHSALKHIQRAGIPVVGADAAGEPLGQVDLRGPMALLMGGEGQGLPGGLRGRCDRLVGIPLGGGLESLNVSVAAAVLMYEKRRQDGWFSGGSADE